MGTVIWVAIGAAAFLCVSVVTAIAVAACLGEMAGRASKLLEEEAWATTPPMRATEAYAPEDAPQPSREAANIRLVD